jgi:hypothetical protein
MTKDRARKRAARDRAAATGERYVVARREAVEAPLPESGVLHELTHRVPGVPAHVDGGLQARARRAPKARPGHQGRPNSSRPRVLVGWQNRIARLLGTK